MTQPRKYTVFISSSYRDLSDHRTEVTKAILREGNIPLGMEMFSADSHPSRETIRQFIDSSELFVIVFGVRLGMTIADDSPETFTQWEFRYAQKKGMRIFAFLLKSNEFKKER